MDGPNYERTPRERKFREMMKAEFGKGNFAQILKVRERHREQGENREREGRERREQEQEREVFGVAVWSKRVWTVPNVP